MRIFRVIKISFGVVVVPIHKVPDVNVPIQLCDEEHSCAHRERERRGEGGDGEEEGEGEGERLHLQWLMIRYIPDLAVWVTTPLQSVALWNYRTSAMHHSAAKSI